MSRYTVSRKGVGGPKTEEGKQKSSMNSLKHGLNAKTPLAQARIARETEIDTEGIVARVRDHYKPADPIEEELVKRIATCIIRLERMSIIEGLIYDPLHGTNCLNLSHKEIIRYERLVDIHLHRAITTLMQKRKLENKNN